MDLSLSRLTQLEEQACLQASSVAQLKAANEAQLDRSQRSRLLGEHVAQNEGQASGEELHRGV